jgi:hypothetical protein
MTLLRVVGGIGSGPYFVRASALVFLLICWGSTGCKKSQPPAENPAEQHTKDLAALPQAPTVGGQLEAEGKARLKDADTITLEQLEDVLKVQGLSFGETRQLMAKQQLALYCARADSTNGIDVTVCEYPSADQAKRGETEGNIVMNKVAGHSSRVRKKSVLHLVRRSDAPDADVEKVFAAFEGLAADAGR